MRLRIIFPDFECNLADVDVSSLMEAIQLWRGNAGDERYLWVLASADRVFLRICDQSLMNNEQFIPGKRYLQLGYLHESAFEKQPVEPTAVSSGIYTLSEEDVQSFTAAVEANGRRKVPEMFFTISRLGVWKSGPMPSFSVS